jgi:hypothetical protein
MIDVEAYIVFLTAIFFTMLALAKRGVTLYAFAYASWQTLAVLWLFLVNAPVSYGGYMVALLFQGFSIVFLVATIMEIFEWIKVRRLGDDLGDAA